jgi:pyridoxamine 5'-phosphate oxidase family protein
MEVTEAQPKTFTGAELAYLSEQPLGRLATLRADGTLQVSPVGFTVDPETGVIEVGGFFMSRSQKYRNVAANGQVALVVDDVPSLDPWRVRCLEIRGVAEAAPGPETAAGPEAADGQQDGALIRITPRRIISMGIENPDQAPHEMTPNNRDV